MQQLALRGHQNSRTGHASLSAVVLGAGVLLTSATQLRSGALAFPVGPGELLLLAWAFWATGRLLVEGNFRHDPPSWGFVLFWAVNGMLLSLGCFVALNQPDRPVSMLSVKHNTQALASAAVLACLMANIGRSERFYLSAARCYVCLAGFVFLFLFVLSGVLPRVLGIEFWWGDIRFRGWAENPNQQALFVLAVPFLAWYLWSREQSAVLKAMYGAAGFACIVVGIATKTDALRVAWVTAAGAIIALHWVQHWVGSRSPVALLMYNIMVPVFLIVLGWWFVPGVLQYLEQVVTDMYHEGYQGEDRLTVWRNGLESMFSSLPAFLFGLGPGSWSGYGGEQIAEAHNVYVDWGTNTGVAGLATYLFLIGWLVHRTVKAKTLALFGLMIAFVVFPLFGYYLRHPVFWFILVLVANLTATPVRNAPRWR
jgi:hypothetical protein